MCNSDAYVNIYTRSIVSYNDTVHMYIASYIVIPLAIHTLCENYYTYSYTCGASSSDLGLPGRLKDVSIQLLCCYDPLEKLYSVGFMGLEGCSPHLLATLRNTEESM